MNPITIPYHLFIPAAISLLIIILIVAKRSGILEKPNGRANWVALVVFFTVYGLIVGVAAYDDIYYQSELNKYDLDGDGFFGGNELTAGQEAAMQNLTSDTGRNFSVFTGFIFAAMLALPIYLFLKLTGQRRQITS